MYTKIDIYVNGGMYMEDILINGVGKKITINNDIVKISKTIGKDKEIPLTEITNIDFEKGTMSKNGTITIEWNNINGKLSEESIIFRYSNNDIVEEIVKAIVRYLEEPEKGLVINKKEKISFFQQVNIEAKNEVKIKLDLKNEEKERLAKIKREKIPYCPKCKSTNLTTTNKKLSVGRAVVGGALLGGVGAVLGGLTSKKVDLLCMNCGRKFKPGKK